MKEIFKWFTLPEDNISLVQTAWFVDNFELTDFIGVDQLLYAFLKYCAELDIVAYRHYLEAFLQTEGKNIIKEYGIRLVTMENFSYDEPASFEEAVRVIFQATMSAYDAYCSIDLVGHTFKVDMRMFMATQKTDRVQQCMAESFPKLSNGDDVDDLIVDMQDKLDNIQTKFNVERLQDLDFMSGGVELSKGVQQQRLLLTTGIPCIDGDIGGLYSKTVWSFTGSPGSGKTRFAIANIVYRAMVISKIDVLMDELELSEAEVRNMLIAHHIIHLYGGKIKIADADMNKGNLTAEQQRYYEAARIDLFESGKYGKLVIRTGDLVVETLEKTMYSYLRHNRNTQLWVIDYAGLAKSEPQKKFAKRLEEFEVIGELYKNAKKIAKVADIGVFIINQFNEKGGQASYMGKRILAGHVQGGQIIQRHADYDLALCMTEEQELARMRSLSTVKKRAAVGFQNKLLSVDLSVSMFRQVKQNIT